jgi:hypothetical protein
MKHFITLALFALSLTACEKEADQAYYTSPEQLIGKQFIYPKDDFANDFYNFAIKPVNPFKVDSLAPGAERGNRNGYWCSSANHVKLLIDPVFITKNLIK